MKRKMLGIICALALAILTSSTYAGGVYTLGHGDVRVYYEAGQLKLRYQLDAGAVVDGLAVNPGGSEPVSLALDELVATLPEAPLVQSPDSRFDFTGAAVGEDLWFIPEGGTEAAALELPWLGFSTEELDQQAWSGETLGDLNFGYLQLQLLSVDGPADSQFSLWYSPQDEISLPLIHFATSDEIDANDVFKSESIHGGTISGLPTSTHVHTNWFFNQPGLYDLTLKFSGTHLIDGYKEAIGSVRFAVAVPEPASAMLVFVGLAAIVGTRSGRRMAVSRIAGCVAALAAFLPSAGAGAAHLDIVPYFEIDAQNNYQFSVGRFDFNKAGDPLQGRPPVPIERNVLVFTGFFATHPVNGQIVNGDPGWDLPENYADYGDSGAEYPAGTQPPRVGRLKFNVVSDSRLGRNLSYWNGIGTPSFGPVPEGEILDIYKPVFPGPPESVTLNGSDVSLPGFELTSTPLWPGNFHTHTATYCGATPPATLPPTICQHPGSIYSRSIWKSKTLRYYRITPIYRCRFRASMPLAQRSMWYSRMDS
jgi:surface-anchored protein